MKKRLLKIVLWVAAAFILLLVTPVLLLSINSVQNFVAQKITNSLSKKLNTEVKIGYVDFRGFNRLKINDLYLADLSGDTLLYAQNIEGKFSLLRLFKQQIVVHSVVLENADIRLVTDTTGTLNAEFLKVLFEKKNKEKKSLLTYRIDDISLKNCKFSYHNRQKINSFAAINLSGINSKISLDKIAENYFAGSIKSLSFNDKSGFKLKDFQTTFLLNDSTCRVTQTKLLLPNSQISLDSIVLKYSNLETLKNNFQKTGIDLGMFSAKINGKDLSPFLPVFSGLTSEITVRLCAFGTIKNLIVERFNVNYGTEIGLAGTFKASGLPDLPHTYVLASIDNLYGSVSSIQKLITGITRKPFMFPKEMQNLQKISYNGKISGYVGNLALLGTLNSNIGSIKTDLSICSDDKFKNMVIEGNINTTGLDLAAIMPSESGFGKIIMDVDAKVKVGKNVNFESKINAKIHSFVFRNYNYNNLIINGNLTKNTFDGNASIDDENGKLNFQGNVELNKENSKFHFNAEVRNFKPNKLNLIKNYPNLELNLGMNANFEGNQIEKIKGNIIFEPITIENNGVFSLKKLSIESKPQNNSLTTTIESELINGYISGTYSFATLPADFMNTLANYMPILKEKFANENIKKNNLDFYFEIEPLRQLCNVLDIAWTTTRKSTLNGFYNSDTKRFNAEMNIPRSTNNTTRLYNTNFRCSNDEKNITLYASTMTKTRRDSLSMSLKADFANDLSNILAQWNNFDKKPIQSGEIYSKMKIFKENDSLMMNINILPTQIVFKNNVLDIKNSNILTNFNWVDIKKFTVSGGEQNIFINGRASKSADDKIFVTLDNFNLDFVNNFINPVSPLAFGGLVSGDVKISQALKKPILDAKLKVPNFIFNNTMMGFVDATSEFDYERNCLAFNGIVTNSADTNAIIDGAFFFKNDSLDLKGDARHLNLGFLKKITKNIFEDIGGYGTGKVHIATRKKHTTVETAAKVDNGHVNIGFLNADFYFNDSIILTKDSILFKKIKVFDAEKNRGTLDGYVAHKYMQNFIYKLNLTSNKMLLFNAKKGGKSQFYGKAYGTGSGTIYGNMEQTNIVCNLTTEPNTKIIIPLDGTSVAASNDFITFVNKNALPVEQSRRRRSESNDEKKGANIMIDISLNANTNAEIQLYLDSRSGDMLRARGDGNLRINYNEKNEILAMNGKYDLLEGDYLFTFQDVLRKKFKIMDGSSVLFNGPPGNPIIDIKAVYQTEASLAGIIDESIIQTNRKKVPVNCLLNITGNLLNPVIAFDLSLPNSDEEYNRALKNIVNTDEMMNRQIIFLLAFGSFYNPLNTDVQAQAQNTTINVVASTLSQQLNNMASQLFDKWNFGVNFNIDDGTATDGKQNNEYTMNFAYMPNDRVTIMGNVGYKNDGATVNSISNYILDFEIEYKLNQSGKLSAKAYNRTNNSSDFKEAPYTQGIGLVYRESFNSAAELAASWKKNRQESKEARKQKKQEKKEKKLKNKK